MFPIAKDFCYSIGEFSARKAPSPLSDVQKPADVIRMAVATVIRLLFL